MVQLGEDRSVLSERAGCHSIPPRISVHIPGSCKTLLGLLEIGKERGGNHFNKMQTEKYSKKQNLLLDSAVADGNCPKHNGILLFAL